MGVDWRAWCVALLLACLWALGESVSLAQRKQEAMKTVMDCTREMKKMIKPKDMKDIKAKRCPSSADAKCIIGCALMRMKMLKKDYTFDQPTLTDFIIKTDGLKEKEKLVDTMKQCADKMGKQKNECSAGGNACNCMKESGVLKTML
ncbi:uncharacterized protein LOC134542333 [Bacillus rossius redtenbacheri]|uniref:uncharacterized protein LOC134542333 n=1 Tax=Bacillus rossius redtenbacheri TaxID=93214 RepID=UPI002FDE3353